MARTRSTQANKSLEETETGISDVKPVASAVEAVYETPKKKRLTYRDFDMMDLVDCQSCVYGQLVYISKKTGYRTEWPEFGSVQPMTIDELITMRNSQPSFFKNGWIRFIGENADDVNNYLHIDMYKTSGIQFDNFDEIFEQDADSIKNYVSGLSDSLKESIARRAIDLIQSKVIDSMAKIEAIESATGFDLSE